MGRSVAVETRVFWVGSAACCLTYLFFRLKLWRLSSDAVRSWDMLSLWWLVSTGLSTIGLVLKPLEKSEKPKS